MRDWADTLSVRVRESIRESIFVRPMAFITAGLVLSIVMLAIDRVVPLAAVPSFLQFDPSTARALYGTLSGATLTVAGITFWVRAASVQLAANQYTPRVVHGFLRDWFQQSMMGLLVGIFTYIVAVYRVIPAEGPQSPHLSIMLGILMSGGSVLVILHAIRNSVDAMQAGSLARQITDVTIARIRESHPAQSAANTVESPTRLPTGRGKVVRSGGSGWVQRIRESDLLAALPEGATVRLDVRVGLFVVRGRVLCTVWSPEGLTESALAQVERAIRLGRSRTMGYDIHYGIQQLVDVALGSLSHGSDTGSAYEAVIHLEMVLRELVMREMPARAVIDDAGRTLLRVREFGFDDYAAEAFDRLRLACAPYPGLVASVLSTIGSLVHEVEDAGWPRRAAALRRQGRLTLEACELAGHLEDDLVAVRELAGHYGLAA